MEDAILFTQKAKATNRKKRLVFAGIFAILIAGLVSYPVLFATPAGETTFNTTGDASVRGARSCEGIAIDETNAVVSFSGQRTWFLKAGLPEDVPTPLVLELVLNLDAFPSWENTKTEYTISDPKTGEVLLSGDFIKNSANEAVSSANVEVAGLPAGSYTASAHISHDCGEFDTRGYSFNVSYPVYITWTFDWEGNDVKQQYLNDMDELTRKHRDFPLTHFFNPRIYATDRVSPERAEYLTQWVIDRRDQYGHQIELHIHMFTDMVSAAGVAPHSDPAWGWTTHDGYDVLVSGYSYDDTNKIVDWATAQFIAHGLGTPTMFRAGGWFADEGTLKVLQDNGFLADSSGRTAFSIGTNNAVSPWNLSATTQPYRPNIYDQNSSAYPLMNIWELPNNGGDSWAFSKDEMYSRYRENYAGGVSDEITVVTYLSHPDWFYMDKPKMDALLTDIERDLYSDDNGPVIFATLEDVYLTWTSN